MAEKKQRPMSPATFKKRVQKLIEDYEYDPEALGNRYEALMEEVLNRMGYRGGTRLVSGCQRY